MIDPITRELYQYIADSQEDEALTEEITDRADAIWNQQFAEVYDYLRHHRNSSSTAERWGQIDEAMDGLLDATMLAARLSLEEEADESL